jgi:hypothetical protein
MGRPSNLSDAKWEELKARLAKGEKAGDLAKEYGTSKPAISRRVSKRIETVKAVANQVVAADEALAALPLPEQILAKTLIDDLKAISTHLASAGKFGAATAHRLSALAHDQVQKVDDADPGGEGSEKALKNVGRLTRLANEASTVPINLLAANKDMVKQAQQSDPVVPVKITIQVEDASIPEPEAQ